MKLQTKITSNTNDTNTCEKKTQLALSLTSKEVVG